MNKSFLLFLLSCFFIIPQISAEENDTINHWGGQVMVNPCIVPTMDSQIKNLVTKNGALTFSAQLRHVSLPKDQDPYAQDYGFPTFYAGVNYNIYNHVRLHRDENGDLGMGQPVDFESRLGNAVSLYAGFERAFFRKYRWEADYAINIGVGFTDRKYDRFTSPDNHMISSFMTIYFGGAFHATYRFAKDWGIKAGLEFNHHSSGTLKRPNKGSNTIGPTLGLVYYPYYDELLKKEQYKQSVPFDKSKYWNVTANVGFCTIYEDWIQTQFKTPMDDPSYRSNNFKKYAVYSLSADYMSRYARRWASGVGIDVYYLSYMDRVKELDKLNNYHKSHSPISIGISGKHDVFYHNLSLSMSLGFYVFRQSGHKAKEVEQPFYESIGLKYHFPKLNNIALGAYVRAHAFKAHNTGISVSCPIRINRP